MVKRNLAIVLGVQLGNRTNRVFNMWGPPKGNALRRMVPGAAPAVSRTARMMQRRSFLNALAALAGAPAVARAEDGKSPADLIVTGATIHTVDDAFPTPQAFCVRGGRFAYVGSRDGAMALRGPRTPVLDLTGYTVLPGLIDAHLHLTAVGLDLVEVDLFKLHSYADVVAKTAAFARTSPDAWILGDGWDQNLWPGKAFPTHAPLSAAIPDRPVALSRLDGHAVLANAKAMQLAGVSKSTPDPAGGRIVRDAQGDPTGVFVDNAQLLIYSKVPGPTRINNSFEPHAPRHRRMQSLGADDRRRTGHQRRAPRGARRVDRVRRLLDSQLCDASGRRGTHRQTSAIRNRRERLRRAPVDSCH